MNNDYVVDDTFSATCDSCGKKGVVKGRDPAPLGWHYRTVFMDDDSKRPLHVLACSSSCVIKFPWKLFV